MRKTLAMLLALALVFGLALSAPAGAEGEAKKLSMAFATDTLVEDLDTNLFTLLLEKRMNVDLTFDLYPSGADALTKFAVVASSGSELPDVINLSMDEASVYTYGSRGVFIPLDEYWANDDMLPTFLANVEPEDQAFMRSAMKSADGHIYCVPSYGPLIWNELCYRMWINKTWLDKLGMTEPKTPDEFKDMLTHFVNDDPNGNGLKDEYGLISSTGGYGKKVTTFLLNAYIEANPDYAYFYIKDGKVTPSFTDDQFKAGLEYLNDLCASGLLSPLSFTQDDTQLKAITNNEGINLVGAVTSGSASVWANYKTNPNYLDMELLEPLVGPEGVQIAPYTPTGLGKRWFITPDCDDPAFAFSVGECMYDRFMSLSNRRGEYGVDWTDDPVELAKYRNVYSAFGMKNYYAVLNDVWGVQQNQHWNLASPNYFSRELAAETTPVDTDFIMPQEPHYGLYVPHAPETVMGTLIYTPEETEQLALVKPAIDTYVNECMVALITGNMQFSEWDKYIGELSNMGLEQYTAIMQAAYDRK